jgi:hypothetical protein
VTDSSANLQARFEELTHAVYAGLRDAYLDPEATFDLACLLMDSWLCSLPVIDLARQLAEQSISADDPVRLADLAGQLLEELGFQPGFDSEPGLFTLLEDALEAVKADLRVSALFAVADDVQDAVMGSLMTGAPQCRQHGLGVHPEERDSQAVWWCSGGGPGHVVAPIGRWIS